MYARAVDDAASRLRELRREEWEDLLLALLALALAVAASRVHPELALPLFFGGLVAGFLGVRALWSRWDLVDRLAGEPDAYVLPDVLEHASREATPERRRALAASIHRTLAEATAAEGRASAAADELDALASDLEDDALVLEPAAAVACSRLLSDEVWDRLLDPELSPELLRSHVRQIRSGFRPRGLVAA